MQSPIGKRLKTPSRLAASTIAASAIVMTDIVLVWRGDQSYSGPRGVLPLVTLAALLLLSGGDLASVGLALRPIQGYRYWMKATLAIGAVVGAIVMAAASVFVGLGLEIPILGVPLALVPSFFVRMCVVAPLVEEATYRLALCTAACVVLTPRGAIVVSGTSFAALHVLYGNPGPDNLVAGFFLAWAYLKSGTILLPLALHALGNLCALAAWVGLWYWRVDLLF